MVWCDAECEISAAGQNHPRHSARGAARGGCGSRLLVPPAAGLFDQSATGDCRGGHAAVQLAVVSSVITWAVTTVTGLLTFLVVMFAVAVPMVGRRLTRDRTWWLTAEPIAAGVVPMVTALLLTGLVPSKGVALAAITGAPHRRHTDGDGARRTPRTGRTGAAPGQGRGRNGSGGPGPGRVPHRSGRARPVTTLPPAADRAVLIPSPAAWSLSDEGRFE
jgi:hypothetical protein